MKKIWISAALLLAVMAPPALAQRGGGDQAAADELRHALERLARTPTDSDALLDAGNAALILRDYDSALRFFTRAEALQPSNGRVKAGLATAQLYSENPVEALKLFDQAIALGVNERTIAADRGLAFDLVGNNALAQSEYALGSTAVTTDDLIIRQAVSFGLAGDQKRADALLNPLLSQNKPTAWRARAFILASHGDVQEATRIVRGFLDARSTAAMQAYLERMSDLTKAQQAAVIHYGHFPAEQQVGRDSEAVRAIASRGGAVRAAASAQDQGLIPTGEPLGRRSQAKADNSASAARQTRAAREATDRQARAARRAIAQADRDRARGRPAAAVEVRTASAAPTALLPAQSQPAASGVQGELPAISAPVAVGAQTAAAAPTPASTAELAAVSPQTASQDASPAAVTAAAAQVPPSPGFQSYDNISALNQLDLAAGSAATPVDGAGNVQGAAIADATPPGAAAPADAAPVTVASIADYTPSAPARDYGPPASAATVAAAPADAAPADAVPSLGAIVRAIDIPPQEKQSNVFAADLARLEQYKDAKPLGPPPAAEASPFTAVAKVPEGAKPLGAPAKKVADTSVKTPAPKPEAKDAKAGAATAKSASAKDEPARNWVQIATGSGDVMKSEYRRLGRGKAELFKGQKGWTSPWKTQERLLVGPFDTLGDARDWLKKYIEAGGEGFAWNSEAGTAVAPLP